MAEESAGYVEELREYAYLILLCSRGVGCRGCPLHDRKGNCHQLERAIELNVMENSWKALTRDER